MRCGVVRCDSSFQADPSGERCQVTHTPKARKLWANRTERIAASIYEIHTIFLGQGHLLLRPVLPTGVLYFYLDWLALSQVSMSHLSRVQEQRITKEDLAFDDMEPNCSAIAGFGSTSSMVGFRFIMQSVSALSARRVVAPLPSLGTLLSFPPCPTGGISGIQDNNSIFVLE